MRCHATGLLVHRRTSTAPGGWGVRYVLGVLDGEDGETRYTVRPLALFAPSTRGDGKEGGIEPRTAKRTPPEGGIIMPWWSGLTPLFLLGAACFSLALTVVLLVMGLGSLEWGWVLPQTAAAFAALVAYRVLGGIIFR